jgi:hypothetical protein
MENKFLTIVMASLSLFGSTSFASAEVTYKTSLGFVFTQVQGPGEFRNAWRDPSGAIWSTNIGTYANWAIKPDVNNVVVDSYATEACASIGGLLPSEGDYQNLMSYFEKPDGRFVSGQGAKDWVAIFPDMKVESDFWTTAAGKQDDIVGVGAETMSSYLNSYGFYIGLGDIDWRTDGLSVRCVYKGNNSK